MLLSEIKEIKGGRVVTKDQELIQCPNCHSTFARDAVRSKMRRYGDSKSSFYTSRHCPNCDKRITLRDANASVESIKSRIDKLERYSGQCKIYGLFDEYRDAQSEIADLKKQIEDIRSGNSTNDKKLTNDAFDEEELREKGRQVTENLKKEIIQLFRDNPNPDDKIIHAFAEEKGYDPHFIENIIYQLVTEHVKMIAKDTNFEPELGEANHVGNNVVEHSPEFDFRNIEKETVENNAFRRVIFTGNNLQLVLMSLLPGEDIGMEVHKNVDQFFRVEEGEGMLEVKNQGTFPLTAGSSIVIRQGTYHNIMNNGKESLKLYTLYAPPNHPPDRLQNTKAEAVKAEKESKLVGDRKTKDVNPGDIVYVSSSKIGKVRIPGYRKGQKLEVVKIQGGAALVQSDNGQEWISIGDLSLTKDVEGLSEIKVMLRDPDNSLGKFLLALAGTANPGHSFEVVMDPDNRETRQTFGFDGDGPFFIKKILKDGEDLDKKVKNN